VGPGLLHPSLSLMESKMHTLASERALGSLHCSQGKALSSGKVWLTPGSLDPPSSTPCSLSGPCCLCSPSCAAFPLAPGPEHRLSPLSQPPSLFA
jgi:hypothetical protein